MDNANITPQGYTYAIAPNTTHPFWKDRSGDSNYIYAPLKNPVVFENTDKNFTRFDVTLEGDVPFIAPLTLSLVSVTINSEVALPFVGVSHGDVAFLICEGIEANQLKVVGVYATTDMSALEIKRIVSIPASIKGDKGDSGQDGVTPQITATASVDQTTGNATVNVTKTGTDTNPAFNFAFTGLKGERGERGEQGQAGANGNDGATGATGATPDITVNATVDETTGTPAVDVTKSGTAENPVFDLAFSGLKGEGGSTTWNTKVTATNNLYTELSEILQTATEIVIEGLLLDSLITGSNTYSFYSDNNVVSMYREQYQTVNSNNHASTLHLYKIAGNWVSADCLTILGAITMYESDTTNYLQIDNPSFYVNNVYSMGKSFGIVLGVIAGSYFLKTASFSGRAINATNFPLLDCTKVSTHTKIHYR